MEVENTLEQFSLRWDNYNDYIKSGFHDLLRGKDLADVTIAAEGKTVLAHKMILSICSPYFKSIFKSTPCQHPVVFLKDVTYNELSVILQFMYLGEVSIKQEELNGFLKTAEALQIKGLFNEVSDIDEVHKENKTMNGINELVVCNDTRSCNVKVSPNDSHQKVELEKFDLDSDVNVSSPSSTNSQVNIEEKAVENIDNEIFTMGPPEIEYIQKEVPVKVEFCSDSDFGCHDTKVNESHEPVGILTNGNKSEKMQDFIGGVIRIIEFDMSSASDNEIRFVISQRQKLSLVFNNYLYIRDHMRMSLPGQAKTYYWRCKNISCKARCIQTDFKFKLKVDTYHTHEPNMDKSYRPVTLKKAWKMLKLMS